MDENETQKRFEDTLEDDLESLDLDD
jgi:hypothetical protein